MSRRRSGRRFTSARRPVRPQPLVIVLALISLTLVLIDRGSSSGPSKALRSAARDGWASIDDSLGTLWPAAGKQDGGSAEVRRLRAENDRLSRELADAQGRLAMNADAERQQKELTSLLVLPTAEGAGKVIARVTLMDVANFDNTFEISKGRSAGIEPGMPVVTAQGLVGRVQQAFQNRSTVVALTDPAFSVGIRMATTGEIGVAEGTGRDQPLRVGLIEVNSPLKVGDVAVTSGTQHSLFPPGVPVGTVQSSEAGPRDLRRDVRLTTFVNLHRLDGVAVLQWRPR